ncbi:hypothetical protein ACWC5G_23935, partial [Streptomyces sp. NPDC001274]
QRQARGAGPHRHDRGGPAPPGGRAEGRVGPAVTGTLFHVPSADFLDAPPPPPSPAPAAAVLPEPASAPVTVPDRSADGSLHIGSLHESAQ